MAGKEERNGGRTLTSDACAGQARRSSSTPSTRRRTTGAYLPAVGVLARIRAERSPCIPLACTQSPAGRRATCYLQTLKYKQAIADFKKLLALEPGNQLVRMQLDSTQKIMRKVEFEKVRLVQSSARANGVTQWVYAYTGYRDGGREERCRTML